MKKTLSFLSKLKKNNRKEWFDQHRGDYETAKVEMKSLVAGFIEGLATADPAIEGLTPSQCMFRINRDVRFSANKDPYKTNMSAFIARGGKKSEGAGYYLHIEPGGSMLAGGIWMPMAEPLRKIRQEIDYSGEELKKILSDKRFKAAFGGLDTEHSLKTAPKGYAKDHPDINLIRLTSFITWCPLDDETVVSAAFQKHLHKKAVLLIPFNRFFNTALV